MYPPEKYITFKDSEVFKETVRGLQVSDDLKLPSLITGRHSILLTLYPVGAPGSLDQRGAGGSPGYDKNQVSAFCEEAQREYEAALADRAAALKAVDDTQNAKSLGAAGLSKLAPGADKGVAGLIYGGGSLANQDAQRDLREAEDRLDRARQKLDSCNWK